MTTSPKRVAASCRRFGGALVLLDRPALTLALTEIRLFVLEECMSASSNGTTLNGASWLFSSRRQAHFLLAYQTVGLLMPNVRAKRRPTAWRDGQAGQNGAKPQPSLDGVPSRWASA